MQHDAVRKQGRPIIALTPDYRTARYIEAQWLAEYPRRRDDELVRVYLQPAAGPIRSQPPAEPTHPGAFICSCYAHVVELGGDTELRRFSIEVAELQRQVPYHAARIETANRRLLFLVEPRNCNGNIGKVQIRRFDIDHRDPAFFVRSRFDAYRRSRPLTRRSHCLEVVGCDQPAIIVNQVFDAPAQRETGQSRNRDAIDVDGGTGTSHALICKLECQLDITTAGFEVRLFERMHGRDSAQAHIVDVDFDVPDPVLDGAIKKLYGGQAQRLAKHFGQLDIGIDRHAYIIAANHQCRNLECAGTLVARPQQVELDVLQADLDRTEAATFRATVLARGQ